MPILQRAKNPIRVTMLQTVAHTGTVLNFGKEHHHLSQRTGQQGNVYQHRDPGKWNPQAPAYGRFWIDAPGGDRKRRTISLGPCATQWLARLRLREYIERAGINSNSTFHQNPVPGTTFRQQAEWWMESLSTRRRRPLKPATIFGWQHCLDRWILPSTTVS